LTSFITSATLVDSTLINTPHKKIIHFGWNDSIIPHGTVDGIRSKLNFTPQKIAEKIFLELS
jgi:deoxyxylulose-5-phosphate synthase